MAGHSVRVVCVQLYISMVLFHDLYKHYDFIGFNVHCAKSFTNVLVFDLSLTTQYHK